MILKEPVRVSWEEAKALQACGVRVTFLLRQSEEYIGLPPDAEGHEYPWTEYINRCYIEGVGDG